MKQKVKQLEALLARSCERIRSNNALKNGLEYQMASKVGSKVVLFGKSSSSSSQKWAECCLGHERTWAQRHHRPLVPPPWLVIWNHVNFGCSNLTPSVSPISHFTLLLIFTLQSPTILMNRDPPLNLTVERFSAVD